MKAVEQPQQDMFDSKKEKRQLYRTHSFQQKDEIEEKFVHKRTYTWKYGTRLNWRPKYRKFTFRNAPKRSPNREFLARKTMSYHQKKTHSAKAWSFKLQRLPEIKEINEVKRIKESDTQKSMDLITEIKHLSDRKGYRTLIMLIYATEKNFNMDTESPDTKHTTGWSNKKTRKWVPKNFN